MHHDHRLVTHVVGARPNFMKAAPVVLALQARGADQRLVHTGQHYDDALSEVFFGDLGLPKPDVNLGVGSGSHAAQTAALLTALEDEFLSHQPALVVVYGDVNSTLAAALAAAKLRFRIAHVEAGLRSFDASMPEEVNRKLTDALADLLFVTSPEALAHLANEGIDPVRMHFVGNPMIDTLLAHLDRFDAEQAKAQLGLGGDYGVATLHRPANVDQPHAAVGLVGALSELTEHLPVVLPLHPRGRTRLLAAGLGQVAGLRVIEPLGYVDFLSLVRGARLVITDSGGIQEETTVLGIPCLTLRPNTERPITLTHGTNRLVTIEGLAHRVAETIQAPPVVADPPPLWDGRAGTRIAAVIQRHLT